MGKLIDLASSTSLEARSARTIPRDYFERERIHEGQPTEMPHLQELENRFIALEQRLIRTGMTAGYVKINLLPSKQLKIPLDAIVEPDNAGFIARTTDIPLYGYGDDPIEAIDALKCEIESLYNDLMEDDQFTEDWLRIKGFLRERIIE